MESTIDQAEKSPVGTLNKTDWAKIGKGALIAAGGALLTYATSVVTNTDFGQYTTVVMAVWSIIVNIANKYFTGK